MQPTRVSIVIPARDETENLPHLFKSLDGLNYPKEYLEIVLGNDESGDSTGWLMDNFASSRPWVQVVHLKSGDGGNLKGKARVLQVLTERAKGDYLFFTDADVILPCTWVDGLLQAFIGNVGVAVGVTGFRTTTVWSALQGIEWLMALSVFKIASDRKIPTTGLGNNMAVSAEAYRAIGGYKSIGFSIVEDYLLYIKIIETGFDFTHVFKPEVMAYTRPPENYFKQRKRWIAGALSHAAHGIVLGILQALSLPILLLIAYFNWKAAAGIFLFLLAVYTFFILYFERKLKLKGYLKFLLLFSIYIPIAWFIQLLYYLFGSKVMWKGRSF